MLAPPTPTSPVAPSATPSTLPTALLAPGSLLIHAKRPEWGVGEVTGKVNDRLSLRFADGHRTFVIPGAPLEAAPAGAVSPRTTRTVKKAAAGAAAGSKAAGTKHVAPASKGSATFDLALAKFQAEFPGWFADPKYLADERDEKWAAHLEFVRTLGDGQGEKLLAANSLEELVERLLKVARSVKFMSGIEQIAYSDALKSHSKPGGSGPAATVGYAKALFELLAALTPGSDEEKAGGVQTVGGVPEALFTRYCQAVAELPVAGRASPNTWPVAMTILALARPDVFLMLKPESAKSMAACMGGAGANLNYSPRPNWLTFTGLTRMGASLLEKLREHGAKDYIDVQSFMWVDSYYGKDG